MKNQAKTLVNNTIMLYIMTVAKLVIPLISLPYLTRVLSVDCYGTVAFVKSLISYFQIFIDFGFLLSATKDIINLLKKKENPSNIIGDSLYAKILLCIISFVGLVICFFCFDILNGYELYTFLSWIVCTLTIFLFEYVFKAYEQMGKIALRYVTMKVLALILTLIFVKSDKDILLMPIFDILASIVAIIMVAFQLKTLEIRITFNIKRFKEAWRSLGKSCIYFISSFATTTFNAMNTIIIGLFLSKSDVAFWSLAMQLVSVVEALYNPIITSAHPAMLKEKNLNIIHKIMLIYMPLIFVGCILVVLLGDWAVTLVFTEKYLMSSTLFKILIPVLIFSFPAMLYGWPCLDAINKTKETTFSTICGALIQIIGLGILIIFGQFNLINLAIVRGITEFVFFLIRICIVYKNKKLFTNENNAKENQIIEMQTKK